MYRTVDISCPSEDEARRISRTLVEERLVAGTQITEAGSHYRWEGAVHDETYWNVHGFTLAAATDDIIARVRELHSDDTPVIAFTAIADGNDDFLDWIEDSIDT